MVAVVVAVVGMFVIDILSALYCMYVSSYVVHTCFVGLYVRAKVWIELSWAGLS